MRVSRHRRGGQGRSRARSNGTEPYLITCGMHGGAGGATADVSCKNCARGGTAGGRAGGGQHSVSIALQGEAWACGRDQGRVQTALGRDLRMQ